MASEIAQCLTATLSADPTTRITAELKLNELTARPAGLTLSQLLLAQDVDISLRQSAGILLRRYIRERWSPFFVQFKGNATQVEVKIQIRQAIFQGLSDPSRKIRSICAQILSSIANSDWPDEYPELLTLLIGLLSSDSPDAVHGAMQVLVEFVSADLSEDQILPVLRELLPVLLSILGAQDRHSALTRARTIVVFRQCVEALYMVKDQHPQAVKEATASILPVWLDAFIVLLNIDPRRDVENTPNWDGLSIRMEVFKTLDICLTSFPRTVTPYVHDVLNASLQHLHALQSAFSHYYLTASSPVPQNSEGGTIDLTNLTCTIFDFVTRAARGSRAREWFSDVNLAALVRAVFDWVQMSNEDEEQWANDPNAFVAQDSDETLQYSTRVAGFDLLSVLIEHSPAVTVSAMNAVTRQIVQESSNNRAARHDDWWRPLEAALAALGATAESVLDCVEDELDSGRPKPIDIEFLLRSVVPALLALSERPFLQGRAFVFASQYTKLLPEELAGQYLDASVQVLEAPEAGVPVKVSAIRAIQNFYQHITASNKQALAPRVVQDLQPFVTQTSEDTLSLVLETLSFVLLVNDGAWITPEIASSLLVSLMEVWTKFNKDPLFVSLLGEIFGALSGSPAPGAYEIVLKQAIPVLCNAILTASSDNAWLAESALDLLDSIIGARGDRDLGDNLFATIAPALFYALATNEDRDVIQSGIALLTLLIRRAFNQLLAWSDPQTGKSGLEHVLAVIAKQLQGEDESGGLFIGDLIIHLLRVAGEAVVPVLPELLQATAKRMQTAKTATFVQSLIIPFAYLIHNDQRDTVLTLLESTDIDGRSALDVVINTWCENAETMQGFWASRISTLALCSLYASERPSLQQLVVKGDIIVKEETRDVIMTRSRTKQSTPPKHVPTEWTRIPFPAKALKLIIHELTSGGESASMGLGDIEPSDLATDDGDETWEDEGHLCPGMDKDEMAFLSELLGPRGAAFDNEEGFDDIDDDDLKADPISQIDLDAHIRTFLRECASRNVNNFSALVDILSPDETLVVQKVVSEQ
ncbi:unnamed protein product [Somion occarium]|uniref:Importin N-terminal domain-containing protein n=1 Tax=Somion occarium TaxID=3059160 RepID=A0ABP1CGU2_9APHY